MFKPQLFPNDPVDINDVKGPYLMSTKLDGIRCIFMDGEMLSRHFKPIRNVQLQKQFNHLKELSVDTGLVFDGELYKHGMNFPDVSGVVMSFDKPVPEDFKFYCFDSYDRFIPDKTAAARFDDYFYSLDNQPHTVRVEQHFVDDRAQILDQYERFLEQGYEGAILKHQLSSYKFGRITYKSGDGYKFKPFRTFEAKVVGVTQATMAKPESPRTRNELGRSETSGRAEDRHIREQNMRYRIFHRGLSFFRIIFPSLPDQS